MLHPPGESSSTTRSLSWLPWAQHRPLLIPPRAGPSSQAVTPASLADADTTWVPVTLLGVPHAHPAPRLHLRLEARSSPMHQNQTPGHSQLPCLVLRGPREAESGSQAGGQGPGPLLRLRTFITQNLDVGRHPAATRSSDSPETSLDRCQFHTNFL